MKKKMLSILIAGVLMVSSSLPVFGNSRVNASTNGITSINITLGSYAKPAPYWAIIPTDLNRGAGGDYIYLTYTKLMSPSYKPITGLYIITNNTPVPAGYTKINVDLNKGAGGDYIYLCYTTNTNMSPITDVKILLGKNAAAPAGYTKFNTDLNKGAGGDYIYLCYTRK